MIHIEACNELHNEADVVLCIGFELGETDWWGKPPYWAPPARQTLDPGGRRRRAARPQPARAISRSSPMRSASWSRCSPGSRDAGARAPSAERRRRVAELAQDKAGDRGKLDALLANRAAPMLTAHVPASCRRVFDDDAVMVLDGGNTAVWGNFFSEIRVPNTQLSTPHFGHLGAGVGQALGAAVARPGRQVYCVIGDGAMAFNMQEIETAVRHDLRAVFLVCCDRQWGMVKISQMLALAPFRESFQRALGPDHAGTINTDLGEIAWDRVAQAMGAHGERVSDPGELEPALRRCLASGRCAVVHVDVDPKAHLLAPGLQYFKDMHQEPAGA